MHSDAGRMVRDILPADWRRWVSAASGAAENGWRAADGDLLTARCLASAGLAALLSLPFLMLASLAVHAPLAAPAALALGYFAIARATAFGQMRLAAAGSLLVFSGLAGWTLLFVLAGGEPSSAAGLAAVLLAPVFAGAPALARALLAARPDGARRAALDRVAWLDELAPAEAVLFLDGAGVVVATTRAAAQTLSANPKGAIADVGALFHRLDHAAILKALTRCRSGAGPATIALLDPRGSRTSGGPFTATIAAAPHGLATMRLQQAACPIEIEEEWRQPDAAGNDALGSAPPASCDLQAAISFAVRLVSRKAKARGVTLVCEGDSDVAVACDCRVCRRVVHILVDGLVTHAGQGGLVSIAARKCKGAALLRVMSRTASEQTAPSAGLDRTLDLATLGGIIDDAGGTMMIEETPRGAAVSVRLVAAPETTAKLGDALCAGTA